VNWKNPNFGFTLKDNHPVSYISWNDAVAFCEWLNEREQKAGRLPQGCRIRLPSEAEWEYACRAGTQTRFWWGNSKDAGVGRLNCYGLEDGFEFVSPVDHFGASGRNRFGLAEMLGNVLEWCLDEFDPTEAHEECYKGNPDARVIKGGSMRDAMGYARSACRSSQWLSRSDANYGFRVCCGVNP
jgi:formylglycine-generating enzyme required for sulfatase activity